MIEYAQISITAKKKYQNIEYKVKVNMFSFVKKIRAEGFTDVAVEISL